MSRIFSGRAKVIRYQSSSLLTWSLLSAFPFHVTIYQSFSCGEDMKEGITWDLEEVHDD